MFTTFFRYLGWNKPKCPWCGFTGYKSFNMNGDNFIAVMCDNCNQGYILPLPEKKKEPP